MKMKRTTGTLITIGALALSQLTAPAAVIYDNLGSIEEYGLEVFSAYSTSPATSVAMSFTVGNTGGTLTSVVVGLGGGYNGGFGLKLYSAGNDLPLSLLGGLSGESTPSSPALYTYIPTAPTSLAANTTYFIVASAGGSESLYSWNFGLAQTGAYANDGSGWIDQVASASMQVNADLSAVPEPSEWAAISFGVLGLVYVAKRRFMPARA
jgi:hypothetical protein